LREIQHIPQTEKERVVVVGGGFAGLELLQRLDRKYFQVVLIDRHNFHQFQPLFYQVATAGLEPSAISFPFRKVFQNRPNTHFRMAEVLSVDTDQKEIHTSIGSLTYDHLVLSMGATTNYFGNQKIEEHALPMKSVGEALALRNTILQNYERALNESDEKKQRALMNIVVVGGGPTGVELAGALAEMKKYILPKDYPELDFDRMQVFFLEGSNRLLASMSEKASAKAQQYLEKLDVQVSLNWAWNYFTYDQSLRLLIKASTKPQTNKSDE
jgi:NADH dehydrogenase